MQTASTQGGQGYFQGEKIIGGIKNFPGLSLVFHWSAPRKEENTKTAQEA